MLLAVIVSGRWLSPLAAGRQVFVYHTAAWLNS
jgi:hypothetical protein